MGIGSEKNGVFSTGIMQQFQAFVEHFLQFKYNAAASELSDREHTGIDNDWMYSFMYQLDYGRLQPVNIASNHKNILFIQHWRRIGEINGTDRIIPLPYTITDPIANVISPKGIFCFRLHEYEKLLMFQAFIPFVNITYLYYNIASYFLQGKNHVKMSGKFPLEGCLCVSRS